MKNFRFYAEMGESRKSKGAAKGREPWTRATLKRYANEGRRVNCVALFLDDNGRPLYQGATGNMDSVSSVFDYEDSPVCGSSVSRDYLSERATRIDESTARALHTNLFRYLDAP